MYLWKFNLYSLRTMLSVKKISLTSLFTLVIFFGLFTQSVFAHCPLCTVGTGLAAVIATSLGVKTIVVALFVGAFALAMGIWTETLIKKEIIPKQRLIIPLLIYFITILPLSPLLTTHGSMGIYLFGHYGTMFNRTYLIDLFLIGALIGGLILFLSPKISLWITLRRKNKTIPYQGMGITFLLLILAALILQIVTR